VVRRTLEFVFAQLPKWRDMPFRPEVEAEDELNSQLCKFLNAAARALDFSMAYFHHEERQTGPRRVDLSALSPQPFIEGRTYFDLEPFLVLEGKRLPAPSRYREREYVIGTDTSSGGIQRFKLGLHGATLHHVGMIGYMQQESPVVWFDRINEWLVALGSSDDALWSSNEKLLEFVYDHPSRTSRCESIHARRDSISPRIRLTHLWIDMQHHEDEAMV
jgi:hypothetical protein